MWAWMLDGMMREFVQQGRLTLTFPDGTRRTYGDASVAAIEVTLHDPTLPRRMALNVELAVGEAYTDGHLTIANDDLDGFLTLATVNAALDDRVWWRVLSARLHKARRIFDQWNPAHKARAWATFLRGAGRRWAGQNQTARRSNHG